MVHFNEEQIMMLYCSGIISDWERSFYEDMIELYNEHQYHVKFTRKQMFKLDEIDAKVLASPIGRVVLECHYGQVALLSPKIGIVLHGKKKDKYTVITNEYIPSKPKHTQKLIDAMKRLIYQQDKDLYFKHFGYSGLASSTTAWQPRPSSTPLITLKDAMADPQMKHYLEQFLNPKPVIAEDIIVEPSDDEPLFYLTL